jgi:hypothetical protein
MTLVSAALTGLFLALAALTRNVTAIFGLFFALMIGLRAWPGEPPRARRLLGGLAAFSLPLLAGVGAQLAYNQARFGNFRDDGLVTQLHTTANPRFKKDFQEHGLFSVHYLARNAWSYFLAWRLPREKDGTLTFDPDGNSMFMVTPAFLYLFLAWRHRSLYTAALLLAAAPLVVTLLFFIGTGWVQFGNRYLLDAMPFLLMLVACGMRGRLTNVSVLMIVLSIAMQAFGVYAWDESLFAPIAPLCRLSTLVAFVVIAVLARLVFTLARRAPRDLGPLRVASR